MNKKIYITADVRGQMIHAVDTLADPVRQTLSPKGGNVIYQDAKGNLFLTNDGVTIAKSISVADPLEDAVIQIVKHAALQTNNQAGDGTTTSILLSQNLIKSGLKLVDEGWNPVDLKREFIDFGNKLKMRLQKKKIKIKDDKDLFNIASISANNDPGIAKDVVKVVKSVGHENGLVFINAHNKSETEIVEDSGYVIEQGLFSPELQNTKAAFTAAYHDIPIIVTDKRLYYAEEAETILRAAVKAGHKSIAIIARDFLGQSVNTFIGNHVQGIIQVLLVKDPNITEKDNSSAQDLAAYLGCKLITERSGSLVNKLSEKDFGKVDHIFADEKKTIITRKDKKNPELSMRIAAIRKELERDRDNKKLQRRLSCMTTGMVTIKVGGSTPIETQERVFRYEDAVNATRAAMKDGYLVGGGLALYSAFNQKDHPVELVPTFRKYCEASIRQIAENCGKHGDTLLEQSLSKGDTYGYNALKDTYEDLLKAGVIDPFKVTEMCIDNSISVTNALITASYFNLIDKDNQEQNDQEKSN